MYPVKRKSRLGICKICRKKRFKISQHGNCQHCATEKVELARLQIKHREGAIYEKYLRKMKAALGVI